MRLFLANQGTAEALAAAPAAEVQDRSGAIFATGVLTGVAIAAMIPWQALETISPVLRIIGVTALCGACLLFRFALQNKKARRFAGVFGVMAGGFLMASGQHFGSSALTLMLCVMGAVAFLSGLALLLRDRQPTRAEREGAIQRLLEVEASTPCGADAAEDLRPMPISAGDSDRWATDVLALVTAIGTRPSAPYSGAEQRVEDSKRHVA